jgi:MoaA/NifB/PqqE/SkfB family radical SAM enzyme
MVGWGEPLIHPQFGYILDKLKAKADRRARIDLTTNGVHLEKWTDRLIEANVRDFAISIHAATPETHRDLMGLPEDAFEKVLAGVRKLVAKRKWFSKMLGKLRIYRGINVSLVFIVTKQNLAEIPDFITLAEELKVDNIFFRTLKARTLEEQKSDGLDYQRLPPYLHPQFEELRARAVKAISRTRVRINAAPDTWSIGIFPKEVEAEILKSPLTPREVKRASKSYRHAVQRDSETLPIGEPDGSGAPRVLETMENPYNRTYPFLCPSPYTALYINGFDRQVTPCCYMGTIPGHKPVYLRKGASFDDVWNSPAMIELRRSLHEGPLKQPCLKCAFYW